MGEDGYGGPWVSLAMFYLATDTFSGSDQSIPGRTVQLSFERPGIIDLGFAFCAFGFPLKDREVVTLHLAWIGPDDVEIASREITMSIQAPWLGGMVAGVQRLPFAEYGMYWLSVSYLGRELTRTPMLATLPPSGPIPEA